MSIIKSLAFGSEGSYEILGIPVSFQNSSETLPGLGTDCISQLAKKCINNTAFRLISGGYIHVFVHEMCHAVAMKLFGNGTPEVHVYSDTCQGDTSFPGIEALETWKETIIHAAGTIGNIAFSSCELIAAIALKSYLSWPIALALGGGAVVWITGELLYSFVSTINQDDGDFGSIAKTDTMHLVLALAAIVAECALAVFLAIKLAF